MRVEAIPEIDHTTMPQGFFMVVAGIRFGGRIAGPTLVVTCRTAYGITKDPCN